MSNEHPERLASNHWKSMLKGNVLVKRSDKMSSLSIVDEKKEAGRAVQPLWQFLMLPSSWEIDD
jgi:hypothetical protein